MHSKNSSTDSKNLISLKIAVILVSLIAILGVYSWGPIRQDQAFHKFADTRTYFRIANFWNVCSNVGFLIVGVMGFAKLTWQKSLSVLPHIRNAYQVFFVGICLVAFGSSYYHLKPNNITLVWDRAPMTITFMALLAICLAEYLSVEWGKRSLWFMIIIGQLSVFYWYRSELEGNGDLRPYVIVQFLPALLTPILIVSGKSKFNNRWGYWILLLAYSLAKLAERFDEPLYAFTKHAISGHTIKHLLIAAGLFGLIRYYERRGN